MPPIVTPRSSAWPRSGRGRSRSSRTASGTTAGISWPIRRGTSSASPRVERDPADAASGRLPGMTEPPMLFTSESVTEGHPDKLCDQISDAILDDVLARRPRGRVACEMAATTGLVFVLGEITTDAYVDFQAVVRETVREIGYTDARARLRLRDLRRASSRSRSSRPTSRWASTTRSRRSKGSTGRARRRRPGNDVRLRLRRDARADAAADRARPPADPPARRGRARTALSLAAARRQEPGDRRVRRRAQPARVAHRRVSPSTTPRSTTSDLRDEVDREGHRARDPAPSCSTTRPRYHINPTGRFVDRRPAWATRASPAARSSSTPTAAWPATAAAPSAARTRRRSTARPPTWPATWPRTSSPPAWPSAVESSSPTPSASPSRSPSTSRPSAPASVADARSWRLVDEHFDLRPGAIIEDLDLRRPIYRQTAAYGHFGRTDLDLPWERTDHAAALRDLAGLRGEVPVDPPRAHPMGRGTCPAAVARPPIRGLVARVRALVAPPRSAAGRGIPALPAILRRGSSRCRISPPSAPVTIAAPARRR